MNESQFAKLLSGYINGTCTQEEIALINKWYTKYHSDPDFINTLSDQEREFLKDRLFDNILEGVHISRVETEPVVTSEKYLLQSWWAKLAVAAVLFFALKLVLPDKYFFSSGPSNTVSSEMSVLNKTKLILKQVLPDKSVVWLNPGARLTFPGTFASAMRKVQMSGECFFEITKNPERPFIISTAHLVTKVWGTSFRVADQKEAQIATVTVVTGKVSVSKIGSAEAAAETKLSEGEVILLPKEEIVYKKSEDKLITNKQANMSELNRWKRVNLTFDNTLLPEIVKVLDEKFKVSIQINDESMNKISMTADLTDLNLPEVLEVLKTSLKISYEVSDHRILLKNQL